MTYEGRETEGSGKGLFCRHLEENSKQKWTVAVIITVTLTEILLNIQ
jgi:hypothetical protein